MPSARDELARVEAETIEHNRALGDRARLIGRTDFAAAFARAVATGTDTLDALTAPELMWVTADMLRVAMDAARDVPGFDATEAPAPYGMVGFATPLPGFDTSPLRGLRLRDGQTWTRPVVADGLLWQTRPSGVRISLIGQTKRLPAPISPATRPRVEELLAITIPRVCGLDDLPGAVAAETGIQQIPRAPAEALALASLTAAIWHLSQIPSLAARTVVDARTTRPAADGELVSARHRVTMIDLRPLRAVITDRERGTGRPLTTRHVVRGHWTHQPHGPGGSLRRLQYVEPYVRGPEGAPLIRSEQVMIWRR